ncbi:MAG: MBOAT family protein [Lachnospiraceae bacterium]|nr:MBOAT family protein [Lachnospiraceae bacterium]
MLFNSQFFIFIFLPICLVVWYLLRKFKRYNLSLAFLIGMSLWFYGYFDIHYLYIIILSIAINYLISFLIKKIEKLKKFFLITGLVCNLALLGYFKYFDFFVSNINAVFKTDFALKHIVLPLGISFFTLQQISYIVDRYKGTAPHVNILKYASFVTFFPQLVAGPIVLHSTLLPQFEAENARKFDINGFLEGAVRFILGLIKKVLIADLFALPVDYGFDKLYYLDTPSAWIVAICYTLEIYYDFSGYSDMAIGLGKMFGIDLPENFDSPYKATSVRDFWKRWHITLTSFLTSYLYIPLGGNRKGSFLTALNTIIVFAVSGFWHGASWAFVLWGVLHGFGVLWSRRHFLKVKNKLPARIFTMFFLVVTWTIFRSETLNTALIMLKKMFIPSNTGFIIDIGSTMSLLPELKGLMEKILHIGAPTLYMVYATLLGVFIVIAFVLCNLKNAREITAEQKQKNYSFGFIICLGVAFALCVIYMTRVSTFLYFNF